jgi:hypothetical protein
MIVAIAAGMQRLHTLKASSWHISILSAALLSTALSSALSSTGRESSDTDYSLGTHHGRLNSLGIDIAKHAQHPFALDQRAQTHAVVALIEIPAGLLSTT